MLTSMLEAVSELSYAKSPNWDGEEADAVHEDTIAVAERLARLVTGPAASVGEPPEIYPTPRGEIDFSWSVDGRMLTVGVCPPPEHTIVYACLVGEEQARGRAPWRDVLPRRVRACLEMLVNPSA